MKKFILTMVMAALVFGYAGNTAEAHNSNKGLSTYAHRYYWGYMSYVNHPDVHKMEKRLRLIGTISEKAAGAASLWLPGVPAKIFGTAIIFGGDTGGMAANYLAKKDKGRGLKIRIFRPNFYGLKSSQYMITGIWAR